MSARILVVDDVPANVKLLEARLSAEYFDVLTAANGAEALAICARAECDIILLDVMMPDIDGFEVCRRLKSNPATHFIPVVMVTALDSPSDRVRGLEAGADDFLTKPVSDIVLIARVRSLTRLKMMTDELRMRAITSLEIGVQAPERSAVADTGKGGRILLVDDRPSSYERLAPMLSTEHTVDVETNPSEALFHAADGNYDLLIVSLGLDNFDGLRLCSYSPSPTPTTIPGCFAGSRSASTIICCARSTRTNCWPAPAPKSASAAIPTICATMCRIPSRWRSPTR
jgi:two-component system cell cycle response regulator